MLDLENHEKLNPVTVRKLNPFKFELNTIDFLKVKEKVQRNIIALNDEFL